MTRILLLLAGLLMGCAARYVKREQLPPETVFYENQRQFRVTVSTQWKKYPVLADDKDPGAEIDTEILGKKAKIIGEYAKATSWSDNTRAIPQAYCIGEIEGYGYGFVPQHVIEQERRDTELQATTEERQRSSDQSESNLKARDRALFLAVKSGDFSEMQIALASGANVNSSDKNGITPLMHAAQRNFPDMLIALLKRGAKINARTKAKVTALMMAAGLGHYESTKILLAYRADVNLKDENGMTAYDTANLTQNHEIMLLLTSSGAKN